MRKIAEVFVFGLLAIGVHMFLLADSPDQGTDAGGSGGIAMVTVQLAPAQIETMVEEWTRPPQVHQQVDIDQPNVETAVEMAPVESIRIDAAPNATFKLAAMPTPDQASPKQPLTLQPTQVKPPETIADPTLTPVPQLTRPTPRPQAKADQSPKQAVVPPAPASDLTVDQLPEPVEAPPPLPTPKVEKKTEPKPMPKTKPKPQKKAELAKKKQPASDGGASQKAAGAGGSSNAGISNSSNASTLSKGQEESLINAWGARIRAQVVRRQRSSSMKGRVVLHVTVSASGSLRGVSIARSSGNSKLDAAAVSAVKRAGRFPRAPKKLTKSSYPFVLPISYSK